MMSVCRARQGIMIINGRIFVDKIDIIISLISGCGLLPVLFSAGESR